MGDKQTGNWFVLHCKNDDSHVLCEQSRVICEESAKTGDTVKFVYPGVKHFLDGVVKGISGEFLYF